MRREEGEAGRERGEESGRQKREVLRCRKGERNEATKWSERKKKRKGEITGG